MAITSCIVHPKQSRFIQVYEWQIIFCKQNHCAALLLSFFRSWHDWKLKHDFYYKKFNDIVEAHGEGRPHIENAYLFFTKEELAEGCMGFYGKNAINEAIELLISLNVITTHPNPNKRYHFDKTKYYRFYPEICNRWISKNYSLVDEETSQFIDSKDAPKQEDRLFEKSFIDSSKEDNGIAEIGQPIAENCQYITNTTNNKTNINKLINKNFQDEFLNKSKKHPCMQNEDSQKVTEVIEALMKAGFPKARLQYPDTIKNIQEVLQAGASINNFVETYYDILQVKKEEQFALNYLIKVLKTKMNHLEQNNIKKSPEEYEIDCTKGLDWMGDLLG